MFDFLKLIDKKKALVIFILGLVSGLMSFLFLGFINMMLGLVIQNKNTLDPVYVVLFIVLMLGFMWARRALSYVIIKFSQQVFWKLRTEVLSTILNASYFQINKRTDQIHASLTTDVMVLTNFSMSLIQLMSAIVMTVGCFTYMGTMSGTLLLITIGVSILGIIIYLVGVHFNKKEFEITRSLENSFMKSFLDLLSGFKEIHMNPRIGKDIYNQKIKVISNDSFISSTKALRGFLNVQIISEVIFYCLIAFILIFHTYFTSESSASIVSFVFILLYLLGSINSIMFIIPEMVQAKISSTKLTNLKNDLRDERFENVIEKRSLSQEEFIEISVKDLAFDYISESEGESFKVGPVSFSINKGDAVFLYGGNGSGKTTLINLLVGILKNNSGSITFNGTLLNHENYGEYRSMFSVVFSDFHLFEEFYGIENVDVELISEYLEMFELNNKVSFENNGFTSNELSTGQRKRLALIYALIRQNAVLVLDEWAADQDPFFRKKFYQEIIPKLKERGFTILAITHDDAYYYTADKLFKMEDGMLSDQTSVKGSKQAINL